MTSTSAYRGQHAAQQQRMANLPPQQEAQTYPPLQPVNPDGLDGLRAALPEYGFLLHEAGLCEAHGLPVRQETATKLQELRGMVQNRYPQYMQAAEQQAMQYAEQYRAEYYEQAKQREADSTAVQAADAARDLTDDFSTGKLTVEQRQAVSRGEKIKVSTGRKDFDPELWQLVAEKTGFENHDQMAEALDHLASVKDSDPKRFKAVLESHPGLTEGDVEGWKDQGHGLVVGFLKRNWEADEAAGTPYEEEITPDEQDVRKANVQDAWMDVAQTPPTDKYEAPDPALLQDEGRTGDVARAWAAHEDAAR